MKRIISHYSSIPQLLEELVQKQDHQVTGLIICSSKDDFLHQFIPSLQHDHQQRSRPTAQEIPSSQDDEPAIQPERPTSDEPTLQHPLLTPTLSQLAATQTI